MVRVNKSANYQEGSKLFNSLVRLAETATVPDFLVRLGILILNYYRLYTEGKGGIEKIHRARRQLITELRKGPIALFTSEAKDQHYEVSPAFFKYVLGPRLKYSCCYYPDGNERLQEAEEKMLSLTCERAGVGNEQEILELGCGWGALTLWMAEKYPSAKITAVSNAKSQRDNIMKASRKHGFSNIEVITKDMNDFDTKGRFDRIVSIEMFEHMRNYQELLRRISTWMKPDAKLFVHIFSHRKLSYFFNSEGEHNWIGKHFFTGGLMPSDDLLLHFQDDLILEDHWVLSGIHYQKTAEHWLQNLSRQREAIMPLLEETYGKSEALLWFQRWRIFFMACAVLWGFRNGNEWHVSHYLFRKRF